MPRWKLAVLGVAIALHAFAVMAVAVEASHLNYNTAADLPSMLDGTAYSPFAHRVLMPWTIRAIRAVTPQSLQSGIERWCVGNEGARYVLMHIDAPPELAYEGLLELGLMYLCLLGFAVFVFRAARILFPDSDAPALMAPFLGLASVSSLWPQLYMYDEATLLVWAACLYETVRGRWDRFFVWFVLGMLNRETTLYLVLPFVAYGWRTLPRAKVLRYGAALVATGVAIKLCLIFRYSDNPGANVFWDVSGQFQYVFTKPYDLIDWIGALTVLLLLTYRWKEKPLVLRWQLIALVPLVLVYITAGSPREYRVFFEIIPAASLLAAHTLSAWWR
ncbi:MAG TPA: hypothetical protein VFV19_16410 [Candidatus Polarisedimenticolaceae bacterium]|nr:hypothetical protein [Candidatus Polarisedimenticolaceae bacterium]